MNDLGSWPLLKLVAEFRNVSTLITKSVHRCLVVKVYFDPYLNNLVAPDYLLTDICKCLTEFLLLQFDDNVEQEQKNIALAVSMKVVGTGSHSITFNSAIKNNSMSVSAVYALLLARHAVLMSVELFPDDIIHKALQIFTNLFSAALR